MHKKSKFITLFKERFFLRFHMSLILIGTALTGLLATKLLLELQVEKMYIRYPFAVIVAYLAFLGFIRLWLIYVSPGRKESLTDTAADIMSNTIDFPSGSGSVPKDVLIGKGGNFGGGGASGTFDSLSDGVEVPTSSSAMIPIDDTASDGIASVAGEAASSVFDSEEGGIILIILGVILALIFGAGIYLLYQAPIILSEAAFEFLLASSLVRKAKQVDNPDWFGSIFRVTCIPFIKVLVLTIGAAAIMNSVNPEADKLSDFM